MKLRMLLAAGIGIVLVLGAGVSPAFAKGAESVKIKGPGLDAPIRLETEPEGPVPVHRLVDATGLYAALSPEPGTASLTATAPSGDLGPRYVAIFTMFGPDGESPKLRQRLYPFAEDGPLVYTPGGQSLFDNPPIDGGWLRAGDNLTALLVNLGVPEPD